MIELILVISFSDLGCEVGQDLLMLYLRWLAIGLACSLMMSSHIWWLIVLDFGCF